MPEKKAMVTGACGFMGFSLAKLLIEKGYDVRATDLETAKKDDFDELGLEFIPSDLTELKTLAKAVKDVDVIFHTASLFDYSSFTPWETFEKVNIQGAKNLCEAALGTDLESFVHWSSAAVYGEPKSDLLPIKEDHPKNPETNYDKSKWLQEKEVMRYHRENGLPAVIIRPAPTYGPGNTYGIAQLWVAIAKGYLQVFPAFSDWKLPLVHVDDVLHSALFLVDNGEEGEAYNLVDDQNYDMKEVINHVASLTGSYIYDLPFGNRALKMTRLFSRFVPRLEKKYRKAGKEPIFERDALFYAKGNWWVSNEKIKEAGFEFMYPDFRDGIMETLDWLREEGMI